MTTPLSDPVSGSHRKLEQRDKNFLQLLTRSPELEGGWRKVSSLVWPLVIEQHKRQPELTRIRTIGEEHQVKLSAEGMVVIKWLL